MPHTYRGIVSLLAVVLCLGALPGRVLAQAESAATPASTPSASASVFDIRPEAGDDPDMTARGYFVYELAAGEAASGSVLIRNTGTEPVTVELSVADAETAQAGGSAFAPTEAEPVATGQWVVLDEERVRLEPDDQASVGFAVEVPSETAPGQYLAGLVAYIPNVPEGTPSAEAAQAGAAIIMQTRYVIGVQVDVPGEWTPSLTITGAQVLEQPSGTKLGIEIRNDGDTFLQPSGSVTLSDAAATPITTEPIQLGTFIPGTSIIYPVAWPGAPNPGDYGVEVELTYAEDGIARYGGTVSVSETAPAAPAVPDEEEQPAVAPAPAPAPSPIQPWMIYALGALLALIVILLALLLIRSNRRARW